MKKILHFQFVDLFTFDGIYRLLLPSDHSIKCAKSILNRPFTELNCYQNNMSSAKLLDNNKGKIKRDHLKTYKMIKDLRYS